ncbi:MAG: pitrilysin family protein, partial [Marinoscillum sp.]
MIRIFNWPFLGLILLIVGCSSPETVTNDAYSFKVPVDYYSLENGLKVVLSEDKTAPTVVVAVYYNIGFRNEPRDRTGFAHLFEHMMFQGSENLGKMEFVKLVQQNGGVLNGSTRFDFTNYFEILPAHKLQTALWAEADRMSGLAINQDNLTNQQGVVKNEVKVNVLNQPYGGFPWLDMPQYANENWYNAHNFYGDLEDLDAATLEDVQSFFDTFYAPNNAVLVVVGDFESAETKSWIKEYFGTLQSMELPAPADISEPIQTKSKEFTKVDSLATRPALAFAYQMPERNTADYYAMGLIDQLLLQGDDALFTQKFVKDKGYTGSINGGINMLGNMFNYNGPMLWMGSLVHDKEVAVDTIK